MYLKQIAVDHNVLNKGLRTIDKQQQRKNPNRTSPTAGSWSAKATIMMQSACLMHL